MKIGILDCGYVANMHRCTTVQYPKLQLADLYDSERGEIGPVHAEMIDGIVRRTLTAKYINEAGAAWLATSKLEQMEPVQ